MGLKQFVKLKNLSKSLNSLKEVALAFLVFFVGTIETNLMGAWLRFGQKSFFPFLICIMLKKGVGNSQPKFNCQSPCYKRDTKLTVLVM